MAKLPSHAEYNDLTGSEARQILEQRVGLVFDQVPYFQKHITLPRCRMRVQIEIVLNAEHPGGQVIPITDDFSINNQAIEQPDAVITSEDVLDASPGPAREGHKPPDQLRDEHGLERPAGRMPAVFNPRPSTDATLPPPPAPVELPGVRIERGYSEKMGRHGTFVTQDRGGPASAGTPVRQPQFRNDDRGPSDPLDRSFGQNEPRR